MPDPTVLVIAESVDSAAASLLAQRLVGTFRFLPPPACDGWQSRQFLTFLEALTENAPDILLLGCGRQDLHAHVPVDEYRKNLRSLAARARKMGTSILWCGMTSEENGSELYRRAAGEVMDAEEVTTADFPGFIQDLATGSPEGNRPGVDLLRKRMVDFLAEALGQWWAVCAKSNPAVVRTRLWPGPPPEFQYHGAERISKLGRVEHVSEPEITRFLPTVPSRGMAVVVFPGGGYGFMGFLRNARELAAILAPRGIPVFGLKYRTGRGAEIPLLDAARAVRWVRSHAAPWGIDSRRIGVAGISAGAHLALSLATNASAADPNAEDPVERVSSRPDFVAAFSVWNFGRTESPFTFRGDVPPTFLRHARDDPAFALAETVVDQLNAATVPCNFRFLDRGGHGAFDLAPGNPGADWPDDFLKWAESLG